jgi:hypothetical protein
MAGRRIAFGKNVTPTKIYIKGQIPGRTVAMVLDRNGCMELAENLIKAARTMADHAELTLFVKRKTPVVSVTGTR